MKNLLLDQCFQSLLFIGVFVGIFIYLILELRMIIIAIRHAGSFSVGLSHYARKNSEYRSYFFFRSTTSFFLFILIISLIIVFVIRFGIKQERICLAEKIITKIDTLIIKDTIIVEKRPKTTNLEIKQIFNYFLGNENVYYE